MPAADSPAVIVARFLKANNYSESYDAFIHEAGLPYEAGDVAKGDLTLELLLEEKKNFDLSVRFEKLGTDDGSSGWTSPAPANITDVSTLPARSNVLNVSVEKVANGACRIIATTADRRLHVLTTPDLNLLVSTGVLHDAPILSCAMLKGRYLMTTSMAGNLILSDLEGKVLEKRRDHTKFAVKVVVFDDGGDLRAATAGWDGKVYIYKLAVSESQVSVGEPVACIELPTKPEAIIFLRHPQNQRPLLLISRTDSTFLYYYTVDEEEPRLLGRQNLAPHSNAWVAFTPSALALCPTDPSLVGVATSAVPHMKVIIVRLLFPPFDGSDMAPRDTTQRLRTSLLDDSPETETQASQARAALAVADRESAAIQVHCSSLSPQTAYSTPAIAWRPDGSGIWVNGDDGVVRGVEASTGKIVTTLQGHDAGSKVRTLWAGMVGSDGVQEEWLVSGGFDQRLLVWRANR